MTEGQVADRMAASWELSTEGIKECGSAVSRRMAGEERGGQGIGTAPVYRVSGEPPEKVARLVWPGLGGGTFERRRGREEVCWPGSGWETEKLLVSQASSLEGVSYKTRTR